MRPVALVGFMGAGKTSVGRALARKLGLKFIDLDEMVEEKENKSIAEIFKVYGEDCFRDKETETLKEALLQKDTVISCGGGIILRDVNRTVMKENAFVIYLRADGDEIFKRVGDTGDKRPLLNVDDPLSEINRILEIRVPLYENVSDIIVDTKDMDIESIVEIIINEIDDLEIKDSSK